MAHKFACVPISGNAYGINMETAFSPVWTMLGENTSAQQNLTTSITACTTLMGFIWTHAWSIHV
jgi:hypothetical protein